MSSEQASFHGRMLPLARHIRTLRADGFFDPSDVDHRFGGWRLRAQVVEKTLAQLLDDLQAEIGVRSRFDCYSDAMLGYTIAEAAAESFCDCDGLGPEAHDARRRVLELLLRYWQLVCTVDSAAPAMDLNKRIGSAVSSVIDFDLTMAEHAVRVAGQAHETILDHLRAIERELRRRAVAAPARASALVTLDVLRDWRKAIDAWVAMDVREGEVPDEATDVIAAWADALRVAGLERGWRGDEVLHVVNDVERLAAVVVPMAVGRAGDARVARLSVALVRMLLALAADGDVDAAIANHLRAALVMVSEQGVHARRAVRQWAMEQGVPLPRDLQQLLRPVVEVDTYDVDADGSILGLFDDADVDALADSMRIQRSLQRSLTRIIEARVDRFLIEILVDDEPVTYTQGLWEDDESLHVEIAHGSLIGVRTPPDRLIELRSLGWEDPTEELPNHWQVIGVADRSAGDVAALVVRSMEIAHDPFGDLPEDAVLGVMPPAAAQLAIEDDEAIHGIDLDGDGEYVRVLAPGIRPSGLMPLDVVEDWLDAIREALDDEIEGPPSPGLVDEALSALRAAAAAGRALRLAEGGAPSGDEQAEFNSVLASVDELARSAA